MIFLRLIALLGLILLLPGKVEANVVSFAPPEYLQWLENLKTDMCNRGISRQTLEKVYTYDFYDPHSEVIKSDRKQLEFVLTSTDYLNRIVTPARVKQGRKHYLQLYPLLKEISKRYGVQPEYLIAFWAVETNFGTNFGGHNIIMALTALSYDQRRPEFFKKELFQALKIIDDWKIDYTQMQGSWAGAMGHFQFMPSTFNAYAIDYDGDGQIDVWNSFSDAAASAANYLSTIGWKADQPWGIEISLPWNFNFSQTGRRNSKSIAEWNRLGIRTSAGRRLPFNQDVSAAVITPEGKNGHAYLVLNNYHKIMNWNHSENYALAVGILADYIKSGRQWKPQRQSSALRLKTDDIITVQSFINRTGYGKLDVDGQLGSQTREAVKKIQQKALLPADGYPDQKLLRKIRSYNPEVGFAIPVPERKLHKRN